LQQLASATICTQPAAPQNKHAVQADPPTDFS